MTVDNRELTAAADGLAGIVRDQAQRIAQLAARIRELEAALREIADFSEQFIGDDEDGDERMYKVNQIADTALALDREGEHG